MATGSGLKGVRGEMARDTNTRTTDKQQQLERDYGNKLNGLLVDLEEAMREAEDQITYHRNSRLASLRELIKEKTYIEKQILDHTAQLGQAYEDMKIELRAVIMGKIEDYEEAQAMLKEAAQTEDERDADEDNGIRNDHNTGNGRKHGNSQNGSASADEKQRPKKKVRMVPTKAHNEHADGGRATADRKSIITDVPGKEQVKRAEVMAKQGRRV